MTRCREILAKHAERLDWPLGLEGIAEAAERLVKSYECCERLVEKLSGRASYSVRAASTILYLIEALYDTDYRVLGGSCCLSGVVSEALRLTSHVTERYISELLAVLAAEGIARLVVARECRGAEPGAMIETGGVRIVCAGGREAHAPLDGLGAAVDVVQRATMDLLDAGCAEDPARRGMCASLLLLAERVDNRYMELYSRLCRSKAGCSRGVTLESLASIVEGGGRVEEVDWVEARERLTRPSPSYRKTLERLAKQGCIHPASSLVAMLLPLVATPTGLGAAQALLSHSSVSEACRRLAETLHDIVARSWRLIDGAAIRFDSDICA